MSESNHMTQILCRSLLNCKTEEDVLALLEDLCTYQELEQMSQRAVAAQLLLEGKTYAEITEQTEISSATLSRVSRAVRHGSGGYARFVPRGTIKKE